MRVVLFARARTILPPVDIDVISLITDAEIFAAARCFTLFMLCLMRCRATLMFTEHTRSAEHYRHDQRWRTTTTSTRHHDVHCLRDTDAVEMSLLFHFSSRYCRHGIMF